MSADYPSAFWHHQLPVRQFGGGPQEKAEIVVSQDGKAWITSYPGNVTTTTIALGLTDDMIGEWIHILSEAQAKMREARAR